MEKLEESLPANSIIAVLLEMVNIRISLLFQVRSTLLMKLCTSENFRANAVWRCQLLYDTGQIRTSKVKEFPSECCGDGNYSMIQVKYVLATLKRSPADSNRF
jgi:hypothetical protein